MMLVVLAAVTLLVAITGAGRDAADERPRSSPDPSPGAAPTTARRPLILRAQAPFEPNASEPYPNAKRLAGRALQRLVTYPPRTRPADAAEAPALRAAARRLVRPSVRSTGEVLYAQFGGLTRSRASVMVLLRQRTATARGRSAQTRVVDVRLRLREGRWRLERIASLGGSPVRRPRTLGSAARRVLDNPRIRLPDSARWDIHRGDIDAALLAALDAAAQDRTLAVAVLRSGHPLEVFGTRRRSAHSDGFAADIWAVDGTSVVRQRRVGSPAHRLARRLAATSAQVGSPWTFSGPGRTFTDAVHQDHLHLQRRAVPGRRSARGEQAPEGAPAGGAVSR